MIGVRITIMPRVVVESPYAGDVVGNVEYARKCLKDSIERGEAPFASHLLYPQILNDADDEQRAKGIDIGLIWGASADLVALYVDRGITPGMWKGVETARERRQTVHLRSLRRPGRALTFVDEAFPTRLPDMIEALKRAEWP